MRKVLFLACAAVVALSFGSAKADVINTSAYNVNFGNLGTPVTVDLAAGTYNITYGYTGAAGQYQGWDLKASNFGQPNQGPAVGGCDSSGGNCSAGWLDSFGYTVNGAAGAAGSTTFMGPAATSPTGSGEAFATAAQALAAYSAALPYDTFTLANASNVTFFVPDYSYNVDNYGGVTLQVSAVPEPSSIAIFACGLLCVTAFAMRRRAI